MNNLDTGGMTDTCQEQVISNGSTEAIFYTNLVQLFIQDTFEPFDSLSSYKRIKPEVFEVIFRS